MDPEEGGINRPDRSDYEVTHHTDAIADRDYILAHLNDPGVVILDTRTAAEFLGQDRRVARGGQFVPQLIPIMILGALMYFGLTYVIDESTRELFKLIVNEIKKL